MRFSSAASGASSSSKESKGSNLSGPRLRKKHKRLDAICEKEYNRNRGGLNESSGVTAGESAADLEIRRSSRVRRAPVLLDVSPSPPKKRHRINKKDVVSSVGKSVKSSPQVSSNLEDLDTPGSWKSRLRSKGRNVSFVVKEEGDSPRGKRRLFQETEGGRTEDKVLGKKLGDEKGQSEVGKYTVVKSKRPGRIKATNSPKIEGRVNELCAIKDDVMQEESEVIGNKEKDVALQLDNDLDGVPERETVSGDATELVETEEHLELKDERIFNDSKETVDNTEAFKNEEKEDNMGTIELVEKEDNVEAIELVEKEDIMDTIEHVEKQDDMKTIEDVEKEDSTEAIEHLEKENNTEFLEDVEKEESIEAIEHVEKEVEQLDCGESQTDILEIVATSTNELEGAGCSDERDMKWTKLDEESHVKEYYKVNASKCKSNNILGKPRIKEGRRCGLCGGGTDGKPPKPLAQDAGDSENEAYSGSSASEEPNYDIWDGFGDEPGWLGRLLGPINDRYGIAGIWVHQHCAVWSPEVYFAGLGCLKNVRAALCRGRALKCTRCGRPGATIGCRVDRCPRTYHLPCARANGCIFDHRKFLIACTDHRHLFQPHGIQYLARIKKVKAKKMKLELRKLSNDASRKDIEAEEKWLENCGEDEEFLKRESKRLHRDLARIAPVYIGGTDSESGKLFQGWESVAGLQDVIRCMKEVVILPLLYPEFFDNLGLTPPRGVLLHGYPGTGKTLVVRALIGACARGDKRIAYFARKGADCLGKYVGDAERQLRLLFQVAEKCQPSIIFFDEIDGLAPCRTRRQDQTHSSVVSTLLALLDGLKSRGSVVVIGATNRPDAVDPALRRPGRFDREIYFPLPSLKDRAAILSLHTQRWPKPVSGSLLQWIARKTAGFAGADLQALCTQAAITGLKRNFPLLEILSAAEKSTSSGKRLPLPNFAVEERDWLEALSCSPPPCSRREAGIAANDVVSSPIPFHLIPCILQPLASLLISLYLDERLLLPASLSKAAIMIKSVIVSTLDNKKLHSDCWWSFLDVFIQEADVAKEIERKLLDSGIFLGDLSSSASNDFDDETNAKFEPYLKHTGRAHSNMLQNTSNPSINISGFRMLIAGSPRSGQRHLASCLIHCFVGNVEIRKVDLATISQEGHGDLVQGITQILMKCAGVGSCMVFMPRIDLWAVETPKRVIEDNDTISTNNHCLEKVNSCSRHDHVVEKNNMSGSQRKLAGTVQGITLGASNTWRLFVEQVESICVSTSLIFLATSEVPYSVLPIEIRQFFKKELSKCIQSNHIEHTVPRFFLQINGDFDHDSVIKLSVAKLSRDVVQELIQLIHQRSHIHTTSAEEYRSWDFLDGHIGDGSGDANEFATQCNEESVNKLTLPPNNRTMKGRSNLHLAISSFGYQILRYPHFAELCWFTSKLKEGPSADISGPWKGWPFNSCIIRPSSSVENIAVGSSSGTVKSKEKPGLVRGLIAVGLLAYKGVYTSLREVSFDVRKVLELLVRQINERVQAGKDRYQYVRLLSQVAYLEDVVNSWAYTLQSLELDAPMLVANLNLNARALDNQVQSEECKPYISSKCSNEPEVKELDQQGFATEQIDMDLNREDTNLSYPTSDGRDATTDGSPQKVFLMNNFTPDKPVLHYEHANQLVGKILNEQNKTHPEPSDSGSGRNNVLVDGDSGLSEHVNGFAFPDSAVISEDGLGSGEFGSAKFCSTRNFNYENPGFSGKTANEHMSDAYKSLQDINFRSRKATKSGDLCLYRCCSECINALSSLAKKILIHEWKLYGSRWTVEDVHDIVASLSVDLLSAARRVLVPGINNPFDGKPGHRKGEKLFECPELITCNCNSQGNEIVVPSECSCHSISCTLTTESATSLNSEPTLELKFVFRDGVLVPMDPDKDVAFHCKFETLCLCSLVEMISITKQPSD
ncbi:Spastin [Parasponia andersonii]|uniref:Spastin n=1 Tax=Parasponia andersonii TaxID=3476 RepID=A0A2P5AR29_PARAD|nr:Spastin [Parasponia andersonii]